MDFFKPLHEDEKRYEVEEVGTENDKGLHPYEPEKEEKYKQEREIVAQAGSGIN